MEYRKAMLTAKKDGIIVSEISPNCFKFTSARTKKTGTAWLENGEFDLVRFTYENGEQAEWCLSLKGLFKRLNRI